MILIGPPASFTFSFIVFDLSLFNRFLHSLSLHIHNLCIFLTCCFSRLNMSHWLLCLPLPLIILSICLTADLFFPCHLRFLIHDFICLFNFDLLNSSQSCSELLVLMSISVSFLCGFCPSVFRDVSINIFFLFLFFSPKLFFFVFVF